MTRPEANKKLGQHFLANAGIINKIADIVLGLSHGSSRPILEIGPGPGALTEELLKRKLKVRALEIDERMVMHLNEKFSKEISEGQLKIISQDFLKIDWGTFAKENPEDLVCCGNLPYNIGTEIVFDCLEKLPSAKSFCFMLQKEVVKRFTGEINSGDFGPIAIRFQWCTRLLGQFWVKPGSFVPPPKVDSGVFYFERLSPPLADPLIKEGTYFEVSKVVNLAFQQRRKMMRAIFPHLKNSHWATLRPENIAPEEWLRLPKAL